MPPLQRALPLPPPIRRCRFSVSTPDARCFSDIAAKMIADITLMLARRAPLQIIFCRFSPIRHAALSRHATPLLYAAAAAVSEGPPRRRRRAELAMPPTLMPPLRFHFAVDLFFTRYILLPPMPMTFSPKSAAADYFRHMSSVSAAPMLPPPLADCRYAALRFRDCRQRFAAPPRAAAIATLEDRRLLRQDVFRLPAVSMPRPIPPPRDGCFARFTPMPPRPCLAFAFSATRRHAAWLTFLRHWRPYDGYAAARLPISRASHLMICSFTIEQRCRAFSASAPLIFSPLPSLSCFRFRYLLPISCRRRWLFFAAAPPPSAIFDATSFSSAAPPLPPPFAEPQDPHPDVDMLPRYLLDIVAAAAA